MSEDDIKPLGEFYDLDCIDRYIGGRIRKRRTILGMTQKELAEAVDLTFQQIQKYEQGVNRVGASRLYQLAHVLKVSILYFFQKDSDSPFVGLQEPVADAYIADPLSKEAAELVYVFYQIRERKVRRRILELAKVLADTEQFTILPPSKDKDD
jgi:transcriptional regulator with XRE-family HTH domain